MTPRDHLQRLLIEHRTAHDPASSQREILRLFDEAQERPAWQYTLRHMGGLKPYLTQRQYEAQSPAIQKWYEPVSRQQSGECICIKCGLRQDGPREEPTF